MRGHLRALADTLRLPVACSLFLVAASAVTAPSQAYANQELIPTKAEYKASYKKGIPIRGTAVRELKQLEDGSWSYNFDVNSFIVDINERVNFQWVNDYIRPTNYSYERSGWVKDKKATVDFDWTKMSVRNNVENKPWSMTIPEQTLDKLSYQLQLRLDLAKGITDLTYKVADGGHLKEFVFSVIGEEKLDTRLGKIDCIVVEKVRKPDSDRQTRLWFAKDWNYLLVQMVQIEPDGEKYEIYLEKAKVGDRVIKP
ncbi:DUF3108 domain-containing protein [Hahella sp. KA22]|nr:DUF3108 domain-containing protein [Hahella sp. KA22]QAY56968.1 DUF3108 domain-containing protein [Hahella sp. KA22]